MPNTSDCDWAPLSRSAPNRTRLSAPALRAFQNIADHWGLDQKQRIAVLGSPARSTYHTWMRKARAEQDVTLSQDTLLRLSAVLGIYKNLSILFCDRAETLRWLNSAHCCTAFRGASPMYFITYGTQDGLMTVRRYLDGWRQGHVGQGVAEGSFIPVTEEDLVFVSKGETNPLSI